MGYGALVRNKGVGLFALAIVVGSFAALALWGPGSDHTPRVTTPPPQTATRAAADEPARTPGWQVVRDRDAGLVYELPPDWTLADGGESLESSSGVRLGNLADFGPYVCQGAEYGRAFSGSGVARGDDPAETAAELAAAIAADQYSDAGQTARVTLSPPTPVLRDGAHGTVVSADAEAAAGDGADRCVSAKGTVTVVALPTPAGISVVVLAADTEEGAATSVPLADPRVLRAVVDSVRPSR